jgi:hypothetical protein
MLNIFNVEQHASLMVADPGSLTRQFGSVSHGRVNPLPFLTGQANTGT